jgi:hypothetical protein
MCSLTPLLAGRQLGTQPHQGEQVNQLRERCCLAPFLSGQLALVVLAVKQFAKPVIQDAR